LHSGHKRNPQGSQCLLYSGVRIWIVGLLLGILRLILPIALLAAWFAGTVLLWRGKRTGALVLRLLSGLHLVVYSILLWRRLEKWDSFMRATAAFAPDPFTAYLRYRDTTMFLALLVVLYLVALLYSFWGLRPRPAQMTTIS
jgi:hypothetical protein